MKKALIAVLLMTIAGGAYAGTAAEQLFNGNTPAPEVSAPKAERSVEDPVNTTEGYNKLKKMFAEGKLLSPDQMRDGEQDGWLFSDESSDILTVTFKKVTVEASPGAGPLMPNLKTGSCNIVLKFGKNLWLAAREVDILTSSVHLMEDAAPYLIERNMDMRENNGYVILKLTLPGTPEIEEYVYLVK